MKHLLHLKRKAALCIAFICFLCSNLHSQEAWQDLGPNPVSSGNTFFSSIAIAPDGTVYIAYSNETNGKATVMKFNGTNWETVGMAGVSSGGANYISLKVTPGGTPYIGFQDVDNGYKATVMKFNGTNWETVGTAGFSAGWAQYISFEIAPNGTPYIGYKDVANNEKATVMKFNGTSWENVGSAGFSAGGVNQLSFKVAPDGTPYIGYQDAYHGYKATVMMFNGSNWENVGSAGFSAGAAYFTSLAIAPDGKPFIGYMDVASNGKALILKFNGTSWENVGAAGQSEGYATNTSLAITADGSRAVIAYLNVTNASHHTYVQYYNLTPPPSTGPTQLASNFCNTVQGFNIPIYADGLAGATQYRFRVKNGGNVQTLDKSVRYFRISDISGFTYGTTYTVDVAVFVNGEWSGYGAACTISTPALPEARVIEQYCGEELSFKSNIYAEGIQYATAYRFRVTNSGIIQVIEKPSRYFTVNEITGYTYGQTYSIEVAALVHGQWGAYGPSCSITTSNAPTSKLANGYCGTTMPTIKSVVYTRHISRTERYRFSIDDGENTYFIENQASYFGLYDIPGNTYGKTYTVQVSVRLSGQWGPYGDACTVSTPAPSTSRPGTAYVTDAAFVENDAQAANLTLYPNPFTESFIIEMNTMSEDKVTLRAFDMNGRLVEDITVSPEELPSKSFGDRFAAGIYNVVVSQGDYMKAFKIVKN